MTTHFRPLTCERILTKLNKLTALKPDAVYTMNRNPRNLERLRIGYKPDGYHLDKQGKCYWHKLELHLSARYVSAQVKHFENGPVITATTSEWVIKKQLFKTKDTSAFINLARVLAQRCQQAGITEMICTMKTTKNGKLDKFLKTLEANGIVLEESARYKHPTSWDPIRPQKSWEILDDNLQVTNINANEK